MIDQLQAVFAEVFDGDIPEISLETTADDIEQWDSLSHFELVFALESKFGIKFDSRETRELGSVAKICELVQAKADSNVA